MEPPMGHISNGRISVDLYLPDATRGYYRGTRFDWSGMIASLRHGGQEFYGPWYARVDPAVRDFTDDAGGIAVGVNSSAMGPAEEFSTDGKALGFDEAASGGTFLKIGVGVLRRPDDRPYSQFRAYELVDPGTWDTRLEPDSATFTQTVSDPATGYGYVYTKTLRLLPGEPAMRIEHVLRNTGRRPIRTSVYSHNFLVTGLPTGPDLAIDAPFAIRNDPPSSAALARIEGSRIGFARPLGAGDRVFMPVEGFGPTPADYDFRVWNMRTGAGFAVRGDRPLEKVVLWSIRTTVSLEPFVALGVDPGQETRWSYSYSYSAPRQGARRR